MTGGMIEEEEIDSGIEVPGGMEEGTMTETGTGVEVEEEAASATSVISRATLPGSARTMMTGGGVETATGVTSARDLVTSPGTAVMETTIETEAVEEIETEDEVGIGEVIVEETLAATNATNSATSPGSAEMETAMMTA